MALDTPATIAVIGAGPIGLEAALYARFLGYKVTQFERARVAESLRQQGNQLPPAAFVRRRSTLGLAALRAQDDGRMLPADDAMLTTAQWISEYLEPLSRSDLVGGGLQIRTEVISIAVRKTEADDEPDDQTSDADGEEFVYEDGPDVEFDLTIRDAEGRLSHVTADAVIDASGSGFVPSDLPEGMADCVDPDTLAALAAIGVRCPTPLWYGLGQSDANASPETNFASGLDQIRAIFADIGGRRDLDLYKTIQI